MILKPDPLGTNMNLAFPFGEGRVTPFNLHFAQALHACKKASVEGLRVEFNKLCKLLELFT